VNPPATFETSRLRLRPPAVADAAAIFDAHGWERHLTPSDAELMEFGRLVATAARPIDDVRGTAAYRLHALGVMAARTLTWAWRDYRRTGSAAGRG